MEKEKMLGQLDQAIEDRLPDVWDQIETKLYKSETASITNVVIPGNFRPGRKKRAVYSRAALSAAIILMAVSAMAFTPALAAIQEAFSKLFANVDDEGVKNAVNLGYGQAVGQTYVDEANGISVHLDGLMTDDKETKMLLTYQSEELNLKNHFVDIFEGKSAIYLIDEAGQKKKLKSIGWGSNFYDEKENKMAVALSFDSIKEYKGQNIRLQIENLTIWDGSNKVKELPLVWEFMVKLDDSAISERETIALNKEFSFSGETYKIKQVEYSALETRVIVAGTDTKAIREANGTVYQVKSKLELQLLNARKIDKKYGYTVDEGKQGVFLKSAGEKVNPIFSKGEVVDDPDEYIMIFGPVKDRSNVLLEVSKEINVPLSVK